MSKPVDRAKELRHDQTEAEKRIWEKIRNSHLGVKFRRQAPVGTYITDFLCHDLKLVVEIDGGQHAENKRDEVRTKYLRELGFHVVRFWNDEALTNIEGVVDKLARIIEDRKAGRI
ncbi:MAG: endonuclease domain-containing protein [Alphaproteobacteria bacterium]